MKDKYSDFSENTIKKIIRVLDKIKEESDLNTKEISFYYGNEDSYSDRELEPALAVEVKLEESEIDPVTLRKILGILLSESIILSYKKPKDDSYIIESIVLSDDFIKKYRIFKRKLLDLLPKNSTQGNSTNEIKIIEIPELKIRGFEEKVILAKSKAKKIQLQNFPNGLKWEEITIIFLNDQEVIIKFRNKILQTTYEVMGFQDEKKKLPNKQWTLLQLLAIKNGELSWQNNHNLPLKQINTVKKQKQLLADSLKAYFQIDAQPFWDYNQEKSYKIKMHLVPENNGVSSLKKDFHSQNNDAEIEKFYKDQSPGKY